MNWGDVRLPPRFWNRVVIWPATGCWLFMGGRSSTGYGHLFFNGKMRGIHRLAYVTLVASVPPTMHLDHLCRVKECCNPLHLEPVTPRENAARGVCAMVNRARHAAFRDANKTCKHGHEYTDENTHVASNGKRSCRECARLKAARHRDEPGVRDAINKAKRDARAAGRCAEHQGKAVGE